MPVPFYQTGQIGEKWRVQNKKINCTVKNDHGKNSSALPNKLELKSSWSAILGAGATLVCSFEQLCYSYICVKTRFQLFLPNIALRMRDSHMVELQNRCRNCFNSVCLIPFFQFNVTLNLFSWVFQYIFRKAHDFKICNLRSPNLMSLLKNDREIIIQSLVNVQKLHKSHKWI